MQDGKKVVSFDLGKNTNHETYAALDYNRKCTDSFLCQRYLKRVSIVQWIKAMQELNNFKCTEMVVHKDSRHNISLYKGVS